MTTLLHAAAAATLLLCSAALAQPPQDGPGPFGPPGQGPGGGRMGGGGGMGGPNQPERKLIKQFDEDNDGILSAKERAAAREFMKKEGAGRRRGPGGPGGPGGGGGGGGGFGRPNEEPAKPGPHVSPEDVKNYPGKPLYDNTILRTIFIQFENDDWEAEMADFYHTDVELPATLTVDGKTYKDCGIAFRGASSFFGVSPGRKRSLNISLDAVHDKQRLEGSKTLNLLNANGDPSFLSTVLYAHIAREHIPAPKANFVKVVINGESWGIYVNVQQFDKLFINENFKHEAKADKKPGEKSSEKKDPDKSVGSARWKVKGRPGADSGLRYTGDNVADYKQKYEIKSGDNDEDWAALINLCKVLTQTPIDELESALKPILDIDGVLWFLALDVALVNSDGYWTRASDYSLYRDPKGVFHIIPHDMNESFPANLMGPGMGPGGPGGGQRGGRGGGGPQSRLPDDFDDQPMPRRDRDGAQGQPGDNQRGPGPGGPGAGGGGGRPAATLDPLVALTDRTKPLRSRLLQVPSLRAKYLANLKTIARDSLAWDKLGPFVAQQRALIEDEIKADTRKLATFASFQRATADEPAPAPAPPAGDNPAPRRTGLVLRTFADQRAAFLLNYTEPAKGADDKPATSATPDAKD